MASRFKTLMDLVETKLRAFEADGWKVFLNPDRDPGADELPALVLSYGDEPPEKRSTGAIECETDFGVDIYATAAVGDDLEAAGDAGFVKVYNALIQDDTLGDEADDIARGEIRRDYVREETQARYALISVQFVMRYTTEENDITQAGPG